MQSIMIMNLLIIADNSGPTDSHVSVSGISRDLSNLGYHCKGAENGELYIICVLQNLLKPFIIITTFY